MAIDSLSMPGTALAGIQRGMQGLQRTALDLAQPVTAAGESRQSDDFARSVVELQQHELQTKASSRALKAYNDTLGTLLDIKA